MQRLVQCLKKGIPQRRDSKQAPPRSEAIVSLGAPGQGKAQSASGGHQNAGKTEPLNSLSMNWRTSSE